jgi:hypothetical protein
LSEPSDQDERLPPDDYLRAIGRVAVEWSRLELVVEIIIWAFLFVDHETVTSPWQREKDGRAVTTHIGFPLRVDVMLSLADQREGQGFRPSFDATPIKELASKLREASAKRNHIIQGVWTRVGTTALRQTHRARGQVVPLYEIMAVQQVASIADGISALAAEADAIASALVRFLNGEVREFPPLAP